MINIYCDESCHLEHDDSDIMVLGGISCDKKNIKYISNKIDYLKSKYKIPKYEEIKWTKVSPSKLEFYKELIEMFFSCSLLNFRCVVITGKNKLNNDAFSQSYNEWYYKMYYLLLSKWIDIEKAYSIYIDIKDSNGGNKIRKLQEIINNFLYGFNCVSKIQLVRSEELLILQLCDLIIGAIGYKNRFLSSHFGQHKISKAKSEVCQLIVEKTGLTLENSTSLYESKFNIFVWSPKEI